MQKLIFWALALFSIVQIAMPEIKKQIEDYKKKFPKLEPEEDYEEDVYSGATPVSPSVSQPIDLSTAGTSERIISPISPDGSF